MPEEQGYQGWANYPTWAIALWINNEQGWQESVFEDLREAVGEVVVGDAGYEERDVPLLPWEAGRIVRTNVETVNAYTLTGDPDGDTPASLVADLLGWALDSADWDELGAAFLRDLAEQ